MKKNAKYFLIGAGVLLLGATTAGAVIMMDEPDSSSRSAQQASWDGAQTANVPQPACDDDNIVGKVAGGVLGGVAGSQFGGGSGKTAATIGGSVGGSLLGEEYIPTKNATCR